MVAFDKTEIESGPHAYCAYAHELGHALCTPNDNTQWLKTYTMSINADRVERVANEFAVELLLNDDYLSEHDDCSIYKLAECRGVPRQFIQLKRK